VSAAVLRVDDLCKAFGALNVTRNVSLDVRVGEIHALIGPNGAGKTTLVSQVAGTLAPDRGRILFDGVDVTALGVPARARRGLARVFQISSVIDSFSVRENVTLAALAMNGGAMHFWQAVLAEDVLQAQIAPAIEQVGLLHRAEVTAMNLSHGERRALELAMSLVQRPKLLLLDEPMAGAGREETAQLIALLAGLRGTMSMLLIEHDMDAVFALADRITVLVAGEVTATGTPDAIRADPLVRRAYLGDEEDAA
jgi:branched-chain amino acid transport system ATP-binding protein